MTQSNLNSIMENFHLCSHLPIRAFNNVGQELYSIGYEVHEEQLFKQYFSGRLIRERVSELTTNYFSTYSLPDGISFTMCLIDKEDIEKGTFIIGPYTTLPSMKEVLLFKPASCVHHLIDLLYSISTTTLAPILPNVKAEIPEELDDYNYHVTKAEIYIEKHYTEPITLDGLANYLGIHKSYFCTIFKKVTKQSFCTYTNHLRVEKSKYFLTHTNESILDIALKVGFSSANYYNTNFKKIVGMTPLEYRNKALKK